MSEDDTGSRITKPHPDAAKMLKDVRALIHSEDTGAWKTEVLLGVMEIRLTQKYHSEILQTHLKDDSKKFETHTHKLEDHDRMLNRIKGALALLASICAIAIALIKYVGR